MPSGKVNFMASMDNFYNAQERKALKAAEREKDRLARIGPLESLQDCKTYSKRLIREHRRGNLANQDARIQKDLLSQHVEILKALDIDARLEKLERGDLGGERGGNRPADNTPLSDNGAKGTGTGGNEPGDNTDGSETGGKTDA
jgi:hypothetical protein